MLPTLAYHDSLFLWSGDREFRLFSATGDATGSTVLYLPRERILVTGDVLVRSENGEGGPPSTTDKYNITEWLNSLKGLQTLNADVIVPGHGPALHDKEFLNLTVALFESTISQVHSALERGLSNEPDVEAVVNLDPIRTKFTHDDPEQDKTFRAMASALIKKVYAEAHDGMANP